MRTRKYAVKQDANHTAIVNGLRKLGYAVLDLKSLGGGAPDLLVIKTTADVTRKFISPVLKTTNFIYRDRLWLVEIKTKEGRLSPLQLKWRENWTGPQPIMARSLEDLLSQIQG